MHEVDDDATVAGSDEDYLSDGPDVDLMQIFMKQCLAHDLLSPEAEHRYLIQAKNGNKLARDILIQRNLRLVLRVARKFEYRTRHLTLLDLVTHGVFGLMKAIDKYDPNRKNESGTPIRLTTYAMWWINQMIGRAIHDEDSLIRVPVHVQKERGVYADAYLTLTKAQQRGDLPEDANLFAEVVKYVQARLDRGEIASMLSIRYLSEDRVRKFLDSEAFMPAVWLEDMRVTSRDDVRDSVDIATIMGDADEPFPTPEGSLQTEQTKSVVAAALASLAPKERYVVMRRYGIDGKSPETLEEVGDCLGVTRERVRQIQVQALKNLRKILTRLGVDGAWLRLEE